VNAIIVRNFDAFPDFEMVCEELKLYIPPLRMTESPAVRDLDIAALNVSGARIVPAAPATPLGAT